MILLDFGILAYHEFIKNMKSLLLVIGYNGKNEVERKLYNHIKDNSASKENCIMGGFLEAVLHAAQKQ